MRYAPCYLAAAALASLYACSSDIRSGEPDPSKFTDSSAPPVVADAGPRTPDSALPTTDSSGPAGRVNVWAHIGSEPRVGWTVVAHNAAGDVLREATTGADGKADLDATSVAMVTLLSTTDAFTFAGVKPGDVLELSEPIAPQGAALGTLNVALPSTPSSTAYMGLVSACESLSDSPNRAQWSVAVNASCVGKSGKVRAFALLQDGDYAISHLGVASASTPPAMGSTVSTTVAAYTSPVKLFEFSGPTGLVNLYGGVVVDGLAVDMTAWQRGYTRGGRWPSLGESADYIDFTFSQPDATRPNTSKIYYAARVAGGTAKVDLGAALLTGPVYTDASADNADPVRPTLRWTVQGSTASQQGTLVRTRFANGRTWAVSVPSDAREVRLPALPSASTFAPSMGVDGPYVIGVESTRFANADAFRQRGMYLALSNSLREDGTELTKGYVYFPNVR